MTSFSQLSILKEGIEQHSFISLVHGSPFGLSEIRLHFLGTAHQFAVPSIMQAACCDASILPTKEIYDLDLLSEKSVGD